MEMNFDMERLYKMAPVSTIQTLRARLESGKSISEIIHDFRLSHGLIPPTNALVNKAAIY